ncbi:VOC family protein [Candidatus Dojkabacteria bacterium]|nr:VOC family protein [Candidatus Dojkabacteria bacterium]
MILTNYKDFLDTILKKMQDQGIDTSELEIDHIGYRAASMEDYEERKKELSKVGEIKHDVQVGDVKVAIYEFFEPLAYNDQRIPAIEIVSPKEGETQEAFLEHIEIVPPVSLEDFMKKYPDLEWVDSRIDRDIFPMITLDLGDGMKVKFPRRKVLVEVDRIK